jgi:hypothetical protein
VDDTDRETRLGARLARAAAAAGWGALAVAAVAQFASRVGPGRWSLLIAAAAALPLTALGAAVSTLDALLRHHARRAAVGVVLSALGLLSVAPSVRAAADPPPWAADGPVLRVLGVNPYLGNDDPGLLEGLRRAAASADVVVVCELQRPTIERPILDDPGLLARFPHRIRADDVVVLSRYPLEELRRDDLGGGGDEVTLLRVGAPRPFLFVGAHAKAPLDRSARRRHAALFAWAAERFRASHRDGVPLVLAGDLNAARWQPSLASVLAAGARDAHEVAGRPFAVTWPTRVGGLPTIPFLHLDHVLVNDGVAVRSVRDVDIPGSDHQSVLAELVVDPSWSARLGAAPT